MTIPYPRIPPEIVRVGPLALRWYGMISSTITIVLVMSGLLPLDVHGFGGVVLVQGIWFVLAGRMMTRESIPPDEGGSDRIDG